MDNILLQNRSEGVSPVRFGLGDLFNAVLIVIAFGIGGCATVPKEVVELSYTVGEDLEAVHTSYTALIQRHFDNLRTQATTVLETRWVPAFLADFIQRGELIQSVQGPDPKMVLEDVRDWAEVAIETIEEKRKELIDPINKDEEALLASVNEAFARLIRANAAITAHLNSLRKVQEVQDETLQALNLKDLRDKINTGLISASEKAQIAIEKLKEAEGSLDKVKEKGKQLKGRIKGDQTNE